MHSCNQRQHIWTFGKIFTDYGTGVEYIRYCENCGYEDPGEDDAIPECPAEED